MSQQRARRSGLVPGAPWGQALAVATIYIVTAWLASGMGEPMLYPYKAPYWPPTGVALAVALMGWRVWPGLLAGSLAGSWLTPQHVPFPAASVIAMSDLVVVAVGSWLYRHAASPVRDMFAPRQVLGFALTCGLAAPLLAALIGTAGFSALGVTHSSDFLYVTWAWWAKDALSVLVLTPWILAWRERWPVAWTPWSTMLAGALVLLVLVTSLTVFGGVFPTGVYDYPLTYLPILLLGWTAYRFGLQGATSAVLIVTTVAVWGTLSGTGPFARETRFESMILLQSFMGLVALATLLFAATVLAHRRAEVELARRTGELAAAKEIDRLKTDFVSNVSHELRTPLVSIVGYTEFLEDEVAGPLNQTQREYLGEIHAGGVRLSRLVDDLLDFARFSAGTFSLALEPGDLREPAAACVRSLAPQAKREGLRLTLDLPEAPVIVRVDAGRIEQVLMNLVGNAIKFTPEGGSVTLRVLPAAEGGRVEVVDTGVGLAAEQLDRVFTQFFQVDSGLTRVHGGVGLGLAISRALVEAHGGRIGASSTPGVGSTFWFELPEARDEEVWGERG